MLNAGEDFNGNSAYHGLGVQYISGGTLSSKLVDEKLNLTLH